MRIHLDRQMCLENEQIKLLPLSMNDAQAHFNAVDENKSHIMPVLPWCHANFSLYDSKRWIIACEYGWQQGNFLSFGIWRKQDNLFIGNIDLQNVNYDYQFASIGYWVRYSALGQGVATMACRLLAEFAFKKLKLQRLEIHTLPENRASQKVAEKVGAVKEGIARNRVFTNQGVRDSVVYSLIPSDL